MRLVLPLLSSLVLYAAAQDTNLTTVEAAFDSANIPTNASLTFNPTVLLDVTFPQTSARPVVLHAGIQLPQNDTAQTPIYNVVTQQRRPVNGTFVVAAIDLDAGPQYADLRHYLGGNYHTTLGGLLANTTPPVTNWTQPAPPAGSGLHRYTFWVFNQSYAFNNQTYVTASTPITGFNLSEFASAVGLGDPIGGTYMLVGPPAT